MAAPGPGWSSGCKRPGGSCGRWCAPTTNAPSGYANPGCKPWSATCTTAERLLPALDGAESVYVAYPVAAGIVDALANVASVIHELGSSPHVVINGHGAADHNSPERNRPSSMPSRKS